MEILVTSLIVPSINILYPHMGLPTTLGPQAPYHLKPVLGCLTVCLFFGTLAVFPNSRFNQYLFLWLFCLRNRIMMSTHPLVKFMQQPLL